MNKEVFYRLALVSSVFLTAPSFAMEQGAGMSGGHSLEIGKPMMQQQSMQQGQAQKQDRQGMQQQRMHKKGMHKQGMHKRGQHGLAKMLNLTDEQKKSVKAIKTDYRQKFKSQRETFKQTQKAIMAMSMSETFDKAEAERLADQQAKRFKAMFLERVAMQRKMFDVLTPEQRTKLKQLMEKKQQRSHSYKKHY